MRISVYHPERPWVYDVDIDKMYLRIRQWPNVWTPYASNWDKDQEGFYLPLGQVNTAVLEDLSDEFWAWVPET